MRQRCLLAFQYALDGFTQVLQEMEPIRNLHRVWRTLGCPVDILRTAIAGDDGNARVLVQPGREGGSRTVWQQVNRLMAFHIDQQGAVGLPFAKGKIINTQDARGRSGKVWRTFGEAQHGAWAHGHPLARGNACADLTTHFERQLALFGGQATGASCRRGNRCGKSFGKDAALTGMIAAKEAPRGE